MLSKASLDYHTTLKSPSQITKDAGNIGHDGSRLFPNKEGLNINQICNAIYNSGLVTELRQPDMEHEASEIAVLSNSYIKQTINAYSRIGIPIILIIAVPNPADPEAYGLHALTVSGFKQTNLAPVNDNAERLSYASDFIDKIYAHDDQFGPFVRVEFEGDGEIKCPWNENDPKKRKTLVSSIIVPLYPKIRISYAEIKLLVLGYDRIITTAFDGKTNLDLVWDIKLDFSEGFKNSIKNSNLSNREKLNLLTTSLPRYIWIADCYLGTDKVFSFTFDATDMANGMIGINIIVYYDGVKDDLIRLISQEGDKFKKLFKRRNNGSMYIKHFITQLTKD